MSLRMSLGLALGVLVACAPPQTGQGPSDGSTSGTSPSGQAGSFTDQEKALVTRVGEGFDQVSGTSADTLLARAARLRAEGGSAPADALIANGAASLVTNSSAALIANGAASLISNSSAALISNSSAALIANGAASLISNSSAALKSVAPLTTRAPYRVTSLASRVGVPAFAIASGGAFTTEDTGVWPAVPAIGRVEGNRLIRDGRGAVVEESNYVHQVDGVQGGRLTSFVRTDTIRASSLRPAGTYELAYGPQVSASVQAQVLRQSVQIAGQALRECIQKVMVSQVGAEVRTLLEGQGVNSRGLTFARQATTSIVPAPAGALGVEHEEQLAWAGGALRFRFQGEQASGSSLVATGSLIVRLEASSAEPAMGLVLYLDQRPDAVSGKAQLAYEGALIDASGQPKGTIRSYRRSADGLPVLGLEVAPGRIVAMPQGWLDLMREGAGSW
jgi:hypothetical protein